jgi:hypothetical protein
MKPLLRALGGIIAALLLILGLLLAGPALAWCATTPAGPCIVAVVLLAQAQRPTTPSQLPPGRPTLDLYAWLSERDLLAVLLAQEVR